MPMKAGSEKKKKKKKDNETKLVQWIPPKIISPSLLTKQHPFSFSLLLYLQTFPSSLKSTHPNIVLVMA